MGMNETLEEKLAHQRAADEAAGIRRLGSQSPAAAVAASQIYRRVKDLEHVVKALKQRVRKLEQDSHAPVNVDDRVYAVLKERGLLQVAEDAKFKRLVKRWLRYFHGSKLDDREALRRAKEYARKGEKPPQE